MDNNFTNQQIDIMSLPDWQNVNFEHVSPKYKTVIALRYLLLILFFVGVVLLVSYLNKEFAQREYLIFLACGTGLLLFFAGIHIWSSQFWGYALREHDVLFRSGIFSKSVEIVPFKHIQYVHLKEGLLSRWFQLASIEVHTAGEGQSLKISGIERANSLVIQDFVSGKVVGETDKQSL